MERNYGTWQGRLPQELRLRGIHDLERANEFLRGEYVNEFNAKFALPAARKAVRLCVRGGLIWTGFSVCSTNRNRSRTPGWTCVDPLRAACECTVREQSTAAANTEAAWHATLADRPGGSMISKASFRGTHCTRSAENRSRLNPTGGLCPGPNLRLRISFHICQTKPNPKPDISLAI